MLARVKAKVKFSTVNIEKMNLCRWKRVSIARQTTRSASRDKSSSFGAKRAIFVRQSAVTSYILSASQENQGCATRQ